MKVICACLRSRGQGLPHLGNGVRVVLDQFQGRSQLEAFCTEGVKLLLPPQLEPWRDTVTLGSDELLARSLPSLSASVLLLRTSARKFWLTMLASARRMVYTRVVA